MKKTERAKKRIKEAMKAYQDFGIYDFTDYAEEIKGDALFKINGDSTSCSNKAPSSPSTAPSLAPKESAPTQTTTTTTTPAPAPAQTTTPSGPTGPDSSSSSSEKKSNIKEPTTYAAYKQKQDEAKRDRKDRKVYVDYNVLSDHRSKAYNIELKVRNLPDRKKSVEGNTIKGNDLRAKLFKQTEFDSENGFTDRFAQTACNATSLLNIFSQQYTKETGQQLSFEDACYALKKATTEKCTIYHKNKKGKWDPFIETAIDSVNALVNDGATALNVMIDALEEKYGDDSIFDGYFGYKKGSLSDILDDSYSVYKVSANNFPYHFINDIDIPGGLFIECYDTLTGEGRNITKDEILGTTVYNYYK